MVIQFIARFVHGTETLLATLVIGTTVYLLSFPLLGLQSAPGDDIFAMTLIVLAWLSGLILAFTVIIRRIGSLVEGFKAQ